MRIRMKQLYCTFCYEDTILPVAKSAELKSSFWQLEHRNYTRLEENTWASRKENTFSHSTKRIFIRLIWHPSHHIWHVYSLLVWCIWRHGVSLWERWITYIRKGIVHTNCTVPSGWGEGGINIIGPELWEQAGLPHNQPMMLWQWSVQDTPEEDAKHFHSG